MTTIDDLLTGWTESERTGDVDRLGHLLADDFAGIGPAGFVLDKAGWLGRFSHGLHYEHLSLEEVAIHHHRDTAFVVAHQHARGEADGRPTFDDLRVSFIVVPSDGNQLRIAGMQYSFMGIPEAGR